MSYNSFEAVRYFPCLLKLEYYTEDQSARDLFQSISERVPTWLFLSWQAQIISFLGSPLSELVISIIKRLANEYPAALMHNFKFSIENNASLKNNSFIQETFKHLFDENSNRFFTTLQYLTQPELFLYYHLQESLSDLLNYNAIL